MFRLRKLTVSLLLIAAITVLTITPAMAAAGAGKTDGAAPAARQTALVDPVTIAEVIKAAYSAYKSFVSGSQSAQVATQQILAAIQQARDTIISHIDAVATASVKSCALSAVIDFPNFDVLTLDNQQAFALNATSCVTLADSLLGTVTDKGAIDQLGFALNAVGPIALITRSRLGLNNTALTPVLNRSNQAVFNQLAPSCQIIHEAGNPVHEVLCTAYNGDSDQEIAGMMALAKEEAASNTSWPVAKVALPLLT
jgi:hypothetical protein